MIGQKILHYKILDKLGEGGMGIVYKAEDTKLKREVAIKFLPRQIATSDDERERFKIEAQAAAALNHPNIATIHAIEEHNDRIFIVMEYIKGRELREIINSELPDLQSAIEYTIQIASGLQAAHEKGIIHRDIKASNIMVTEKGQVKIMDFGLAKIRGGVQLTREQSTIGTAAYMSPEQARGDAVDQRTDIWSFGIVLYEMLIGQFPFKGEYDQAIIYAILNEPPTDLLGLRDDMPDSLTRVVQKCLAKDPDARYQNAGEIGSDLQASEMPTVTFTGVTPSKSSGRRWPMLFTGAVLLFSLMAAGLIFFLSDDPKDTIDTLAILPFSNQNEEQEIAYLSDGIPETVIFGLSQVPTLKIRSLSSVSRYKGAQPDLHEVARDLDVQAVLMGKVSLRNQNLAVVVELVDTRDNTTIWGNTYNRNLTDLVAVQEEITKDILSQLRFELSGEERHTIGRSYTQNSAAYHAYLKGRYFEQRRSEANFGKALDYYERAIALDPAYALAYSGLSDTYSLIAVYGFDDYDKSFEKARKAAERALELDNMLAEAYTSLGLVREAYDWQLAAAEELYRRAIELNLNYVKAFHHYGYLLSALTRHDEAIAAAKAALELEPLSPVMNRGLGLAYYMARDYKRALRYFETALELNAGSLSAAWHLVLVNWGLKRFEESVEMAERYLKIGGEEDLARALRWAYERQGYEAALRQLTKSNTAFASLEYYRAVLFGIIGDKEAYLGLLKSAVDKRSAPGWIQADPAFDAVRSDSRFATLLDKLFGSQDDQRLKTIF